MAHPILTLLLPYLKQILPPPSYLIQIRTGDKNQGLVRQIDTPRQLREDWTLPPPIKNPCFRITLLRRRHPLFRIARIIRNSSLPLLLLPASSLYPPPPPPPPPHTAVEREHPMWRRLFMTFAGAGAGEGGGDFLASSVGGRRDS